MIKMYQAEANLYMALTFLCLLLHCAGVTDDSVCPVECSCFWDESRKGIVANCSTQDAKSFPHNIPDNTVELHLEGYNYTQLTEVSLPSLLHLERLSINNCNIEVIDPHAIDLKKFPKLKVLDLRNNALEYIPLGLPSNIKTLLLSQNAVKEINATCLNFLPHLRELFLDYNSIKLVGNESFPGTTDAIVLSHLQKLALNNNEIAGIESDAFSALPFLNALSLASNRISIINGSMFTHLPNLQFLDLQHNQISTVEPESFRKLGTLKTLNLAHNHLREVPRGVPMLERLDVSYNRIQHIPEEHKPDLYPAEVFNFAHNPLHCDCTLLWLKELYVQREYQIKHLDIPAADFIPSCATPKNLAGETWDTLGDGLFGCTPEKAEPAAAPSVELGAELDLQVKSGEVTGYSIQVLWSWSVQGQISVTNVFVQYYVFGLRADTTKHIEVAAVQRELTLKNLRPLSNYILCVIPKDKHTSSTAPKPLSLDHCLEVATKEGDPIEVLSFFYILCYYTLGMCATVIAIFAAIGLVALVYGVYSAKSDWSAKYVPIDEPVDSTDVLGGSGGRTDREGRREAASDDGKVHRD